MAAPRDLASDLRDIADSAIVAIERAFRNANLTVTVVRAFDWPTGPNERPLTALAPAALGNREPQSYHSLPAVAYAWFVWLLDQGLSGAAWTSIENSDYGRRHPIGQFTGPGYGFNPWPVKTPEEDLGSKVFFVGCNTREAMDRFIVGDARKHPSGWGMLQHRRDMLEAIRSRLHWPRLPEGERWVPAPPGQWTNPIAENVREDRRRGN